MLKLAIEYAIFSIIYYKGLIVYRRNLKALNINESVDMMPYNVAFIFFSLYALE